MECIVQYYLEHFCNKFCDTNTDCALFQKQSSSVQEKPPQMSSTNPEAYDSVMYELNPQNDGYSVIEIERDYDYSNVFFQPAMVETDLHEQLSTLSIPLIRNENLRYALIVTDLTEEC